MSSGTQRLERTTPAGPRRPGAWTGWRDFAEPHLARGPFSRWPRSADAVLAFAAFVGSLFAVALSALGDDETLTIGSIFDRPPGAFALLGLASVALLWRRERPIAVTAFGLGVITAWAIAGYGDGHDLVLVVALYSVGRYADDHRLSLAIAGIATTMDIVGSIIDSHQRVDIAPAIILSALPWYVGYRIRNRGDYVALLHERAERLEAEQQAKARQAVADERSRIARELHDVVAHRVSMMTVQAGAAKTIARVDLDSAVDAMGDVERAGRQALGELRHLLGVLRPDATPADALGPQPRLADIAKLADQLGQTGADVSLSLADLGEDLPVAVELSAYRIVQESLTNIIKHAGPNPSVMITIGLDGAGLDVDITNTIHATRGQLPQSGFGITGMRERAQLLDGTLTAEPLPPDRYRVRAHLPLARPTAAHQPNESEHT